MFAVFLMKDDRFNIAFEKANEVLTQLSYKGNDMVDTDEVIKIASRITGRHIKIFELDFSELSTKNADYSNYGAMMRVEKKENGQAHIVINSKRDPVFQRFSLMHEIGHLITDSFSSETEKYILSTQIQFDLTNISEEQYNKSNFLLKEQICNVFALLILIPSKILFKKLTECETIKDVSNFFGVTKDAVISRLMLGDR